MVGLFSILAALVIGVIVGALERRGNEGREIPVIATVGAVIGVSVGHTLGMFSAFGELPGLLCAIAGAIGFVRVYHAETHGMKMREEPPLFEPGSFQSHADEPPLPPVPPITVERPADSLLLTLAEAIAWAVVAAIATGAAGFAGHFIGGKLRTSHADHRLRPWPGAVRRRRPDDTKRLDRLRTGSVERGRRTNAADWRRDLQISEGKW